MEQNPFQWSHSSVVAVTVCDADAKIIYMNEKARRVFEKYGENLLGKSLYDCHNPKSAAVIQKLLNEGGSNIYTIEKMGIKKLIHQSAWLSAEGNIGGLTELSIELPIEMPHFVRS